LPTTVHLLTAPPGPGLTGRLLAEYLRAAREPGRALWLSPSARAADDVVRRVASAGRPILQPSVYCLAGFASTISERATTGRRNRSMRRLVLDEAASELARHGKIPFFRRVAETRGFLDAAGGFLEEVESLGVTPDELRAADGGPRAAKLAACAELYAAVAARSGDARPALASAAAVIKLGAPPPFDRIRAMFVDGFASFTPAEWRLVEAVARDADLWVALPADEGERPDAFAAVMETRRRLVALGGRDSEAASDDPVSNAGSEARPVGLVHLEQHLFGPTFPPATDAAGLQLVEAPGPLGEARLVARRIRTLLSAGTKPDAIVVTARDLTHSINLLGEVFAEYGLPVELDGGEAVLRNPAVGSLLRALRLADDDWPFAGVTALLRSTYFRPAWPETTGDTPRQADGLLRLLGEPRGREAYLRAISRLAL
jgi:ATP-dependent helicase/DNAse subunit B